MLAANRTYFEFYLRKDKEFNLAQLWYNLHVNFINKR